MPTPCPTCNSHPVGGCAGLDPTQTSYEQAYFTVLYVMALGIKIRPPDDPSPPAVAVAALARLIVEDMPELWPCRAIQSLWRVAVARYSQELDYVIRHLVTVDQGVEICTVVINWVHRRVMEDRGGVAPFVSMIKHLYSDVLQNKRGWASFFWYQMEHMAQHAPDFCDSKVVDAYNRCMLRYPHLLPCKECRGNMPKHLAKLPPPAGGICRQDCRKKLTAWIEKLRETERSSRLMVAQSPHMHVA